MGQQTILHLRFGLPPGHDPELLERLRRLLEDFTPRVQMLEPDSAVLDLTGGLRFWTGTPAASPNSSSCARSPCTACAVGRGPPPTEADRFVDS
ncbi:hypothetical protein [Streptomyces mirabilis]|uniref:hypothetical protein n=1 Tax=Streptomyces mirabilis TaxID=68239 RepID=UPI0036908468